MEYKKSTLGLSETESKKYSIFRAIEACISGNWEKAGLEKECSDEITEITAKTSSNFMAMH